MIPDLLRDINLRFSYFEVEKVARPSLVINIGKFKPQTNSRYLVDHQYHIGDGYFYCKDSQKTAKWELEISGIEDEVTTCNFNGFIFGLHEIVYPHIFAQNLIGRFLLQYKLGQKQYFMMHAASVVRNGRAFVFAGRGGANKTSIIMELIRNHDFSFQGDDWIIFNGSTIYSFPTHFHEFNFRTRILPSEYLRGNLDRFRLVGYLNQPFDYANSNIKVSQSGRISMLNVLLKTNKEKLNIIRGADKKLIKNMLYYNNMIEQNETSLSMGLKLKGVSRYLQGYSFINPDNGFQRFFKNFEESIDNLIKDIPCNIIEIPNQYSKPVSEQICSLISEKL